MGCCNSKNEADVSAVNVTLKNENTDMTKKASADALSSTRESMQSQEKKKDSQPPQPSSPKKAPAPKPPEDKQAAEQAKKEDDFDKWAHMEEAEEKSFLASEEETKEIDEALEKEFPGVSQRRSQYADVATWQDLVADIPVEESDFELLPPFTLEKASAFYKHLCMPDARRRNEKRADSLPSISRRSVYEVVVAAFALYTEKAEKEGALQSVPAPTSKHQRLRVCGDTHGQLNDVLWIFDEHGEPSPTNAYLFNGDIADRGRNALEILLLLLCYQLAAPRCVHINRGNHEQRDLTERPSAQVGTCMCACVHACTRARDARARARACACRAATGACLRTCLSLTPPCLCSQDVFRRMSAVGVATSTSGSCRSSSAYCSWAAAAASMASSVALGVTPPRMSDSRGGAEVERWKSCSICPATCTANSRDGTSTRSWKGVRGSSRDKMGTR